MPLNALNFCGRVLDQIPARETNVGIPRLEPECGNPRKQWGALFPLAVDLDQCSLTANANIKIGSKMFSAFPVTFRTRRSASRLLR